MSEQLAVSSVFQLASKEPVPKPPIDRTPYVELVGQISYDANGVTYEELAEMRLQQTRCLTVVLHGGGWEGHALMYHACPIVYKTDGKIVECIYDRSSCVVTWN